MITAQHILSLKENNEIDQELLRAMETERNHVEAYFKKKFQQIDFKIGRTHISKELSASGNIFIKELADSDFKENSKISQRYALNIWKQLKNANTTPEPEGMLVEIRLPRHPHPAFSTIMFFDNVIHLMISPPKSYIVSFEDDPFLRLYLSLGDIYTFSNKDTNLEDYFMEESSLEEKLEAIESLRTAVQKVIDEVIKAIRLNPAV